MKNISIKGIISGCIAQYVISALALMLVFVVGLLFSESIPEEVPMTLEEIIFVLLFLMVVGTLSTGVGGYIAARVAKEAIYLNSGIYGVIVIVWGLLVRGEHPLWYTVLAYIPVLPSALLGGYLASLRQTSNGPWKRARRRFKAIGLHPALLSAPYALSKASPYAASSLDQEDGGTSIVLVLISHLTLTL